MNAVVPCKIDAVFLGQSQTYRLSSSPPILEEKDSSLSLGEAAFEQTHATCDYHARPN